MRKLINQLIIRSKKASPQQLAQWVDQARVAPFADDLLEVDEPLWGGFWQGDVIAPGYRLPAVELALLRAMRLDTTWPEETSVAQFLADLHWATSQPQAGVWTLAVAGEPCVVFASIRSQKSWVRSHGSAVGGSLATVVWYCATTGRLHAGYRAPIDSLSFVGAVEQRQPNFIDARHFEPFDYVPFGSAEPTKSQGETSHWPADDDRREAQRGQVPYGQDRQDRSASHLEAANQSSWLTQVTAQIVVDEQSSLATRLDAEILRLRAQMRK